MEKFVCNKLENNTKYKYILYSTSFESTVNDKKSIVKVLKGQNSFKGYVIVDLLLSKGNNFNRFVELYLENGIIKKINIQKEITIDIKNASFKFYYQNKELLDRKESIFYI